MTGSGSKVTRAWNLNLLSLQGLRCPEKRCCFCCLTRSPLSNSQSHNLTLYLLLYVMGHWCVTWLLCRGFEQGLSLILLLFRLHLLCKPYPSELFSFEDVGIPIDVLELVLSLLYTVIELFECGVILYFGLGWNWVLTRLIYLLDNWLLWSFYNC